MNVEDVRVFCLSLLGVTESLPFGDDALVFKVGGKMFLLLALDTDEPHVSIKCDPDRAIMLKDSYAAVVPAWHFNKKHWISIFLERDMYESSIKANIQASYDLVFSKLTKKVKSEVLSFS